jgi:hypothetical protein
MISDILHSTLGRWLKESVGGGLAERSQISQGAASGWHSKRVQPGVAPPRVDWFSPPLHKAISYTPATLTGAAQPSHIQLLS